MSTMARLLATACIVPFAVSIATSGALSQTVYVNPDGNDANIGRDILQPKRTIQAAIDEADNGDTVLVQEGTYGEHVTIGKPLTLRGESVDLVHLEAPFVGSESAITIANTYDVVIESLHVYRSGNNPGQWGENGTVRGIYAVDCSTSVVRYCFVEGFTEGVMVSGGQENVLRNNAITRNGNGVYLMASIQGLFVINNLIANNWLTGVNISGLEETASNIGINENNISGNWYAQMNFSSEPGTFAVVDASYNHFGFDEVAISSGTELSSSASDIFPDYFGGGYGPPGGTSALFTGNMADVMDVTPWLGSGADMGLEMGFQPYYGVLYVGTQGSQNGPAGRISEAIDIALVDATVNVTPGTYEENIVIDKNLSVYSTDGKENTIIDGQPGSALGTVVFTGTIDMAFFGTMGLGFTVLGLDGPADTVKAAAYFKGSSLSRITLEDNIFTARGDAAIYGERNQTISGIEILGNTIDGKTFTGSNPSGHSLVNQYTLENVPRPLVSFSGDLDSLGASYIAFNDNIVSGTAGGTSYTDDDGEPAEATPQGTHMVELDVVDVGNTVNMNMFHGMTIGPKAAALSMRGMGTFEFENNDFGGLQFPYYFSSAMSAESESFSRAETLFNTVFTSQASYATMSYLVGTTIQSGIDAARVGSTVSVQHGTYMETPIIDKYLVLDGSGSDSASTVLNGGLTIDASGVDSNERVTVQEMRIVGNYGDGVEIAGGRSHILLDAVAVVYHIGDAIHVTGSGAASDIIIRNSDMSNNDGAAFLLDEFQELDHLVLSNIYAENNTKGGFIYNPFNEATSLTDVVFDTVTFIANGADAMAYGGDVLFNGFNDNAALRHLYLYGSSSDAGITFHGATTTTSAGNIQLEDVIINGEYTGAGLQFENYTSVAGITFSETNVDVFAGHALRVAGITGTLKVNNTTNLNTEDGSFVYCDVSSDNNEAGEVDVRFARFNGAYVSELQVPERFDAADRIVDRLDGYSDTEKRAYVRMFANRLYMTPNSTLSPSDDPQIQRAIDVAPSKSRIELRGGSYGTQVASDRYLVDGGGPFQFGLFVSIPNLTIYGYTANDEEVENWEDAAVTFTTQATNLFDATGIWVEGDNFHLHGVHVADNYDSLGNIVNNKTIEIVADGFELSMSSFSVDNQDNGGSVYFGEWTQERFEEGVVRAYNIHDNGFFNVVLSVNNGAGWQGDNSSRLIQNNTFSGSFYPLDVPPPGMQYYIGFRGWNGADPAQIWITRPVGGATITGNVFASDMENVVVVRGNAGGYDSEEIDFDEIWHNNTFAHRTVALSDEGTFTARTYTDVGGYPNTRSITNTITAALSRAECGDVVLVGEGTYGEIYDEKPVFDRCTTVVVKSDEGVAMLSDTSYFIVGTHGVSTANFSGWPTATLNNLGVNVNGSLQDAANTVNPSGTVHMLAGTYNLGSTVTLDSGITVTGPGEVVGCETFAPEVTITTSGNLRTFDVPSTAHVTVRNLAVNIGTGTNNRFFRLTSNGNVTADHVSFLRSSTPLLGTNATASTATDIPKYIDDGYDGGFGSGKVALVGGLMPTGNLAAAWKGSDANALTISSVADNSGNNNPLVQTSVLRKPTRNLVDSNYVISSSVTKYVAANLTSAIHSGSARSLFVVFKTSGTIGNGVVYKHGDHNDGFSVWTSAGNAAGMNVMVNGVTSHCTYTVQPNTWYMAQAYFDGSSDDHRVGMVLHGVPTETTYHRNGVEVPAMMLITPTGVNTVVSAGARQGYSRMGNTALTSNTLGDAFVGSVGEIVVLNTADASVRDQVYCLLSNKWKVGSSSNTLEKDEITPVYAGKQLEPQITAAYPNPASDDVTFSVVPVATEELHISIVNTMGVEVATIFNGIAVGGMELPITADVSTLANGAYMIVVSGANTHFSMPMMKQR